jgi:cyclase
MKPFQLVTMALLNGFFGSLAFAQDQDLLIIEQVKNSLYIILGSGGNVGVRVTDEGVILIDDKSPQIFDDIQSLIASVRQFVGVHYFF